MTPQGLQNPTGLPRPAASTACGLLSRVPESLGRIWNTLVCFSLLVFLHFALFDKRRLRRRFVLLDSYRGKKLAKLWLKALGVLLLCMIVIVAVANATGVIDTSAT